jgi:hypothetical protein
VLETSDEKSVEKILEDENKIQVVSSYFFRFLAAMMATKDLNFPIVK